MAKNNTKATKGAGAKVAAAGLLGLMGGANPFVPSPIQLQPNSPDTDGRA